jgi:hypothetical protein
MTIDDRWSRTMPITALSDPRSLAGAISASGPHPKILYHYTDEVGLRGIISPSWDIDHSALERAAQLWASDVRYMRDSQELLFGAAPLVERLRAVAADSSATPKLADTFGRLADVFSDKDVLRWDLRCFAACLCESPDLVSQWQNYAGTGGYAIGFSWDAVAEHSDALYPESKGGSNIGEFSAGLWRMAYGTPAADALADGLVAALRRAYESPQDDGWIPYLLRSSLERGELLMSASLVLSNLAAVKHDDFQHEREWRLIAVMEPQFPSKVRGRDGNDLPYLDIAVNVNLNGRDDPATIARLVVGPGPDQPSRIAATRELLEERGHDPSVVVGYEGPLRW